MAKHFISYDPDAQITTWYTFDPVTGEGVFIYEQDAEPVVEANKQLQNDGTGGWDHKKEFRHAAHIPALVWYKWLTEEGINIFNKDHWQAVLRKLDSSDYAHLRTAQFKLGKAKL